LSAPDPFADTGLTCYHDGDVIEYHDSVVYFMVIRPFIVNGQLTFFDVLTEDQDDYLYEPVLFHTKNWEDLEEEIRNYERRTQPYEDEHAICTCSICKSGIRQGEHTGLVTMGEIQRSPRDPDGRGYTNTFENLDRSPTLLCILCLYNFNVEVCTLWEDGVCEGDECESGRMARCWRDGCPGNCPEKQREDLEE
jgi:hypothetical protein